MMTNKEILAVVQAADEGKKVQCQDALAMGVWWRVSEPVWNFEKFNYRVEPQPREVWVNVYAGSNCIGYHRTKEEADKSASIDRLECVRFIEAP